MRPDHAWKYNVKGGGGGGGTPKHVGMGYAAEYMFQTPILDTGIQYENWTLGP